MSRTIFIAGQQNEELNGLIKGLANYGYEVRVCKGPDVLGELFKGKVPSAVILDSLYGDLGVLEVCKQTKSNHKYAQVPILILKDKDFEPEEYLAIGIKGFVKRPISLALVHETINLLTPEKKGDLFNDKQRLIGVIIAVILFLAFLTYWVFIPMYIGGNSK